LLLPSSLEELALTFHNEPKGIFPYKYVNNKNISLLYEGEIPKRKYFSKLNEEKYNDYCKIKIKNEI